MVRVILFQGWMGLCRGMEQGEDRLLGLDKVGYRLLVLGVDEDRL